MLIPLQKTYYTNFIDQISYSKESITYRYIDHNTKKEVVETIDTLDFLGRLFYHVLPEDFKSIKRFGAYARNLGKNFIEGIKSSKWNPLIKFQYIFYLI